MEPRPIRFLRNLGRMRQIVSVLLNHGFADLVDRLHLRGYVRFGRRLLFRKTDVAPPLSRGQRIRSVLEDLGPTFVKFGQVLSTRPDLVPDDVIRELKNLCEHVPPFDSQVAREILEREIGPIDDRLSHFEADPLAAGSLAQVHRASLHDGTALAIKILRPDIRGQIERDLDLLHEFATLLVRYVPESKLFDPVGLVKHFERVVRRELSLQRELRTLEEFRRLFRDDATLSVPRVYPEVSTDSVLAMEFVDGLSISDPEELTRHGIDVKAVAANGARIFLKQAFEIGVFHGDPHPGNVRVFSDGSLCLLDYGMIGLLDEETRRRLIDLLLAIARKDVPGVALLVQQIGRPPDDFDRPLLMADVRDFIDSYYGVELGQLNVGRLLSDFVRLMTTHGITCPGDLMLLIRALITLEGTGRSLDPDFDLAPILQPFVESEVRKRYEPQQVAKTVFREARNLFEIACRVPARLEKTLEKLSNNDLRIQLEHRRLDRLITELDRSGNRIVIGLILSALIVASALIHRTDSDSMWLSVPVFTVSAFLGIWLIYGVFRSGRL